MRGDDPRTRDVSYIPEAGAPHRAADRVTEPPGACRRLTFESASIPELCGLCQCYSSSERLMEELDYTSYRVRADLDERVDATTFTNRTAEGLRAFFAECWPPSADGCSPTSLP